MKAIFYLIFIPFLALSNDQPYSDYFKAKAYEKEGDFSSAITFYKKALKLDPTSITIKKSLAYCYLYNNDEALGLSLLKEIVRTEKDPEIWYTIGDIYKKNKMYRTSIEAYNRGLKIKEDINVLYNLAEAYLLAKEIENAIIAYKRIITMFPEEKSALLSLSLIYEEQKDIKGAIETYKRVLEIEPNNIFALQRLISIYLKEDVTEAEDLARRLLKIEESPQSFLLLGIALEKNNKYEDAEGCLKKVKDAGLKGGYIRLGWLMLKNDRIDEGLRIVEEGLECFKGDFDLSLLYGVLLNQTKAYEKAIDIFKELIKKSPDDYLYFQLAIAYDGILNKDWAIRYLYKAIRLNKKNSSAYNYIGYTWAENNKHLKRALRLIEKALEIEPDNPAYIDSLGWCYYKMGDYNLALSSLLKAYHLNNDDPVIIEHIGDVYKDIGDKEKAKEFFLRALDKFKEKDDKERVRNKWKILD